MTVMVEPGNARGPSYVIRDGNDVVYITFDGASRQMKVHVSGNAVTAANARQRILDMFTAALDAGTFEVE